MTPAGGHVGNWLAVLAAFSPSPGAWASELRAQIEGCRVTLCRWLEVLAGEMLVLTRREAEDGRPSPAPFPDPQPSQPAVGASVPDLG